MLKFLSLFAVSYLDFPPCPLFVREDYDIVTMTMKWCCLSLMLVIMATHLCWHLKKSSFQHLVSLSCKLRFCSRNVDCCLVSSGVFWGQKRVSIGGQPCMMCYKYQMVSLCSVGRVGTSTRLNSFPRGSRMLCLELT